MKPRGTRELHSNSLNSYGVPETLHWVPIDALKTRKTYPTFLQDYLRGSRAGIQHIVTDERKKADALHGS